MNRAEHPPLLIADVQSDVDARKLAIDRVGVRSLRHPVTFHDGESAQTTAAQWSLFVALPHDRKGTHMSRMLEIIDAAHGAVAVDALPALLDEICERLEAPSAELELSFPWFVRKAAPVSGVTSVMDYEITLRAEGSPGNVVTTISVIVPVTSLCPSSKAIAEYGAHNQRSHVTMTVRPASAIALAELVRVAESEASAELYGVLKRSDEKYVTEHAYERPRFVEDLVRGVAARLDADPRVEAFRVEAENFESIHNHSAYALIERDKDVEES